MPVTEPCDVAGILHEMECWRQEPFDPEQRNYKRHSVRGDVRIEPIVGDAPVAFDAYCMLRDISRDGAGFVCYQPLPLGSQWRLWFTIRGHNMCAQPVVVRYCKAVQTGVFLVGTQFIVEPWVLCALGVADDDLADEYATKSEDDAFSEFVAPEALRTNEDASSAT